jgi:1-acyl-sn-glycerol-3-phosphate acyltransferase
MSDSTVRIPAPLLWRALLAAARGVTTAVCRLQVTGDVAEELRSTPLVVASNHIGPFDPIVLVSALSRRGLAPRILATAGLFRVPVVGAVLRGCGHIPVNRRAASAADALHEAQAALANGGTIVMYPEGRITVDPGLWPERGKTGLARLALHTGATVVPVAQWGAHEVLAYGGWLAMLETLLRSLRRRPTVRVNIGEPVDLSGLTLDTPGAAHRATERIMDAITAALVPLRRSEPGLPRFIDSTRPVSSARSRRRVGGSAAALAAPQPQVGEHGLPGGAYSQQLTSLGDAPVRGPQRQELGGRRGGDGLAVGQPLQ